MRRVWSCLWQQVVGNDQRHGLTEFGRKIQRFEYMYCLGKSCMLGGEQSLANVVGINREGRKELFNTDKGHQ